MNYFEHKYKKGKHTIKYNCRCAYCEGTGIYRGFAEGNGVGVVCSRCKGEGIVEQSFSWLDPKPLKKMKKMVRVVQCNPGIGIGENKEEGIFMEDFGGMDYNDWFDGKPFPEGSEMRKFTCPAWWCQSYHKTNKPNWDECICCGTFSSCKNFGFKAKCWAKFDRENDTNESTPES